MLSTAYYFLQVVLCSAIMMGYYWMVLRNKKFHQYNRFYLLAVAILSWIVPLIKIEWNSYREGDLQMIRFLSVVADNNSELEAVIGSKGFEWSRELMFIGLYFLVAGFLMIMMLRALYRLYELLKTHPCKNVGDVFLIITQAKGTPFSFFRYIFWNEEIDIRSESGKQILQHELTHVQQRHSIDKMLIQVMLIVGWFNPFFWLLKKEMEMIHEFMADKKAVQHGDTAALAQMLLTAVFPQQRFDLTHPFFFSPIKRRLQMLTNNKNPRFSYIRRLIVLPLLAIVIVLFAFRNKEYREQHPISVKNVLESVINDVNKPKQALITDINLNHSRSIKLSKVYRIVIHPGHGGTDAGARGLDGSTESSLTLQFATMMKEKNSNPNLEIILTRSTDEFNSVVEVTEKANSLSPDLFISLHMNSSATILKNGEVIGKSKQKGAEIFIAQKDKAFDYERSYELANRLGNSMSKAGTVFAGIKSRNKGIYVLQTIKCPSVLVEAGYMTNQEEFTLLKNPVYQEKIVLALLEGIQQFLVTKENTKKEGFIAVADVDTTPKKNIVEERVQFKASYDKRDKTDNNQKEKSNNPYIKFRKKYNDLVGKLILLDGEKISIEKLEAIDPNDIHEIKVTKPPISIENFGKEGKDGVIEILTKQEYLKQNNLISNNIQEEKAIGTRRGTYDKVFIKTETNAIFPGGEIGWQSYLKRNIDLKKPINNGANTGTYKVTASFIVANTGKVSDITIEKDPGYGMGQEVIRILEKGPYWKPALQRGKAVHSKITKTITFFVTKEKPQEQTKESTTAQNYRLDTFYKRPEIPASFPGGLATWASYLQRNLDKNLVKRNGGPPGKYTVLINFLVNADGTISNIRAINDPGYGAKIEAMRMIAKGPNWKPALVKGRQVGSQHEISITFFVPKSA